MDSEQMDISFQDQTVALFAVALTFTFLSAYY